MKSYSSLVKSRSSSFCISIFLFRVTIQQQLQQQRGNHLTPWPFVVFMSRMKIGDGRRPREPTTRMARFICVCVWRWKMLCAEVTYLVPTVPYNSDDGVTTFGILMDPIRWETKQRNSPPKQERVCALFF
jgi:hypothetical protein